MKVWNIEVTDRNGSDGYSFIQEHMPTDEQFDNSKIPTWDQLKEYLKEEYKNKNTND